MVSKAGFLTELIHGPIFIRCICLSLARLSHDREAHAPQLPDVARPSPLHPEARQDGWAHQGHGKATTEFLTPSKEEKEKTVDPVPNPEYENWVVKDQQVFTFLLSSIRKEIFAQVSTSQTVAKLWAAIEGTHASQSHACVVATCMALATASKGTSTIAEYFMKMKSLADEMASAREAAG